MKNFFREFICMLLISAVLVLILVLVFYDYLVNDNTIPTESKYTRTRDVAQALKDKSDYEDKIQESIIGTLTKAAYNIDDTDINEYIAEGLLTQGKTNPFQELKTQNTETNNENDSNNSNKNSGNSSNTNTNTNSNSNSESSNSNSNSSGNSQNSTAGATSNTANSGETSTGTFFEKPGSK